MSSLGGSGGRDFFGASCAPRPPGTGIGGRLDTPGAGAPPRTPLVSSLGGRGGRPRLPSALSSLGGRGGSSRSEILDILRVGKVCDEYDGVGGRGCCGREYFLEERRPVLGCTSPPLSLTPPAPPGTLGTLPPPGTPPAPGTDGRGRFFIPPGGRFAGGRGGGACSMGGARGFSQSDCPVSVL